MSQNNFSYNKLKTNSPHTVMFRPANSDVVGDWSAIVQFITYNNAPSVQTSKPNITDTVDPKQATTFEYLISDSDNDQLTSNLHLWSATTDTIINLTNNSQYILPKDKLKEKTAYSYTITSSDGKKNTTSSTETFNTISTGIEEVIDKAEYKIYPNPTTESVNLEYTLKQKAIIRTKMYDMTGKLEKVLQEQEQYPGTYKKTINLQEFGSGMYIIKTEIVTNSGTYNKVGKIIKK
jgi:hypothetical protein